MVLRFARKKAPAVNEATAQRSFSATAGVYSATPIILSYLGIGFASGAINASAGLSPAEVLALSLILFAGSAQFVFADLYKAQAVVLIGTIFLLNFRHFLYSAAFIPYVRHLSAPARFCIGAQLTDESFVLATTVLPGPLEKARWMLALNMSAYLAWAIANTAGALIGGVGDIATKLGIEFALTAMFAGILALLFLASSKRMATVAVAVSASVVVAAFEWWRPDAVNILIATVIAASIGLLISSKQS